MFSAKGLIKAWFGSFNRGAFQSVKHLNYMIFFSIFGYIFPHLNSFFLKKYTQIAYVGILQTSTMFKLLLLWVMILWWLKSVKHCFIEFSCTYICNIRFTHWKWYHIGSHIYAHYQYILVLIIKTITASSD